MILSNISRMFPGKSETSDKTIPGSVIFLADLLIYTTNISGLNQSTSDYSWNEILDDKYFRDIEM